MNTLKSNDIETPKNSYLETKNKLGDYGAELTRLACIAKYVDWDLATKLPRILHDNDYRENVKKCALAYWNNIKMGAKRKDLDVEGSVDNLINNCEYIGQSLDELDISSKLLETVRQENHFNFALGLWQKVQKATSYKTGDASAEIEEFEGYCRERNLTRSDLRISDNVWENTLNADHINSALGWWLEIRKQSEGGFTHNLSKMAELFDESRIKAKSSRVDVLKKDPLWQERFLSLAKEHLGKKTVDDLLKRATEQEIDISDEIAILLDRKGMSHADEIIADQMWNEYVPSSKQENSSPEATQCNE